MLELYNGSWSEDPPITAAEFARRIELVDVTVPSDGSYVTLWFTDGAMGMFGGHAIDAWFGADLQFRGADCLTYAAPYRTRWYTNLPRVDLPPGGVLQGERSRRLNHPLPAVPLAAAGEPADDRPAPPGRPAGGRPAGRVVLAGVGEHVRLRVVEQLPAEGRVEPTAGQPAPLDQPRPRLGFSIAPRVRSVMLVRNCEGQPHMESPATSVERFGPRVELFTTSNTPVYAGFALGGLFAAVGLGVSGCGLAQFPDVQTDRLAGGRFISGVIGGPLLFLLGAVGVWYARSLRGTGVEVCANGLREWPVVPGKSGGVLWGEVDRIEEHYVYDKVPMKMGGLLLTQTFRQFVVFPRTGPALAYDYTGIARINRLGKKLRAAAETNAIPWKVVGKPEEGGGVWEG